MPDPHRYDQFCPVARAAEVLAQRWSPLIVRELLIGPQRFSDLKSRLRGVSTSMLTKRLALLEHQGVVRQRTLEPPAASTVYELTATGRALEPVLLEMARFGMRVMDPPRAGDHIEPDWFTLAIDAFARRSASPPHRFELRVSNHEREVTLVVEGGPRGTRRIAPDEARNTEARADLRVTAPIFIIMGLASRALPPEAARAHPDVKLEGNADLLAEFPDLFEMPSPRAGDGET